MVGSAERTLSLLAILALASAATAAACTIIWMLIGAIIQIAEHASPKFPPLDKLTNVFFVMLASSAAYTCTIGLALHAAMFGRQKRLASYLIAGVTAGIIVVSLLVVPLLLVSGEFYGAPFGLLVGALLYPFAIILCGLSALFFWLIRRPDRDAPNPDRATP